jgi:hypothetical protein
VSFLRNVCVLLKINCGKDFSLPHIHVNIIQPQFHPLDILQQCIVESSNNPYWLHYYTHLVAKDLRNPKHAEKNKKSKRTVWTITTCTHPKPDLQLAIPKPSLHH